MFELGAFLAASPLLRIIGRGDRHPVLVLPGFTADDRSTAPLRWFLRSQGYWTHGWQLGSNYGPTRRIIQGLDERLEEIYERHERTVTVIGWSLGGIYARMLARRTAGAGPPGHHARQPVPHGGGRPLERRPDLEVARSTASPATCSTTSTSTRTASPRWSCRRPPSTRAPTASCSGTRASSGPATMRENIEVRGSHSGLGWNPAVLMAIADRLAQPEGTWRPFRPPLGSWHLYPRPDVYRAA